MDYTTYKIIHLIGIAILSLGVGGMIAGGNDRKAFAIRYATKLTGAERSAAFLIADGKRDRALEKLTAAALDETVQTLRAGESIAALEEQ